LSPEQRQVLHLVAVDGLSYQEAADAIGIPIGTLISRLSRARARLRAIESGEAGDSRPPVALRIVES
jgi:RNA polymerase sigma-70 factor (ECF subfamily)